MMKIHALFRRRKMLSLGSSRPWAEAMELMTGQRKMDASGLVEYFRPLQKWLEAENKKTGEKIGWSATPRYSEWPAARVC